MSTLQGVIVAKIVRKVGLLMVIAPTLLRPKSHTTYQDVVAHDKPKCCLLNYGRCNVIFAKCCRAVPVSPSVRPSVTFVYSVE